MAESKIVRFARVHIEELSYFGTAQGDHVFPGRQGGFKRCPLMDAREFLAITVDRRMAQSGLEDGLLSVDVKALREAVLEFPPSEPIPEQ